MVNKDNKLLQASRLIEGLKLDEAVDLMVDQVLDGPTNSRSLLELGMILISVRKSQEALETLKKAEEYNPNDAQIYGYMGQAYLFIGDNNNARKSFNKSLSMEHDNLPALNGLGLLENSIGRYSEAERIFTKTIDKYGQLPAILTERAYARGCLNNFEGALEDCTSALYIEPNNVVALQSRANIYSMLGLKDFAMQDLTRLHALSNSKEMLDLVKKRG